jgi:hypothetical protein
MRPRLLIAVVCTVLGIGAIVAAIASATSATDYIKKHYKRDGTDHGAQVYLAPHDVSQTVKEISDADAPGDRRDTESGVFLRYPHNMIAVLVSRKGGTKVEVANERSGYAHFFGYVGGWWGTYSGPAGTFRGGGPGAGK